MALLRFEGEKSRPRHFSVAGENNLWGNGESKPEDGYRFAFVKKIVPVTNFLMNIASLWAFPYASWGAWVEPHPVIAAFRAISHLFAIE
jgi:hypothetical protein